jgi:hypothetical protein
MAEKKVRPFPAPPPEVAALEEAKGERSFSLKDSRTEKFGRVITAVNAACGEAQVLGDENYVRTCEEELFPFLDAEREKAAKEEGLTPLLEWERALYEGRRAELD